MTTKQENKGKIKNTEIELYVINKVKEYRIAAENEPKKTLYGIEIKPYLRVLCRESQIYGEI